MARYRSATAMCLAAPLIDATAAGPHGAISRRQPGSAQARLPATIGRCFPVFSGLARAGITWQNHIRSRGVAMFASDCLRCTPGIDWPGRSGNARRARAPRVTRAEHHE